MVDNTNMEGKYERTRSVSSERFEQETMSKRLLIVQLHMCVSFYSIFRFVHHTQSSVFVTCGSSVHGFIYTLLVSVLLFQTVLYLNFCKSCVYPKLNSPFLSSSLSFSS